MVSDTSEQTPTVGLEPTTTLCRLRQGGLLTACLAARTFCNKQQQTLNAYSPFTNLVSAKARGGFEPRLPDSESEVLTVTPPGQMPLQGFWCCLATCLAGVSQLQALLAFASWPRGPMDNG